MSPVESIVIILANVRDETDCMTCHFYFDLSTEHCLQASIALCVFAISPLWKLALRLNMIVNLLYHVLAFWFWLLIAPINF